MQYLLTLPAHVTELLYPKKIIIFTFSALFDRCSEERTGKQRGEDMRQMDTGRTRARAGHSQPYGKNGQESSLLKMKCLVS